MPDITQPQAVATVEQRLEGRSQGGGRAPASEQPAKKVVANYEEAAKAQPADDRITILGIPVDQITPATQAALGGLVSEINYLRGVVKRQERAGGRKGDATGAGILEPEALLKALGAALSQPAAAGSAWIVLLVHVPTCEDIRRSSGLLAANGVLADVAQRLKDFRMEASGERAPGTMSEMAAAMAGGFNLVGYAGGANLAALAMMTEAHDAADFARAVRAHLTASGYVVSGIEMALVIKTAAAQIGTGESAALAIGRADHLLRAS